ncbi:TOMM precursor leader peptide-binding protein [Streptomyces adustus]
MDGRGGNDVQSPVRADRTLVEFRPHLSALVVPGEATYLISRKGLTALAGRRAEVLAPLLDGSRTVSRVLSAARLRLSREECDAALCELTEAGLLRFRALASGDSAVPATPADRYAEAYWELAGTDSEQAVPRLAGSTLLVGAVGGASAGPLAEACRNLGVQVVTEGAADLALVACEDYLAPELGVLDRELRERGLPWLPVKLCGVEPWVGPVFRHHEGPCWACLAPRLRGHRRSEWPLQQRLGLDRPPGRPVAALPAGLLIAANLASLEAAKWLAGARHPGQAAVFTFDTTDLGARIHPVTRRPQCHVCGDPGLVAAQVRRPFRPASRPKTEWAAGGHRPHTPEQFRERFGHLVDDVTGIVKSVRRAAGAPGFTESYVSGPNLAFGPRTLAALRTGLRTLSGGKGVSPAEAWAGALGEAVERYSATRHGDEPVVVDSYRALGSEAVHPNACQLYHERQLRERDRWNADASPFRYVPPPFDEHAPTEWTPLWSLTGNRHRLLPTSLLYFPGQQEPDRSGLVADSNGTAAGGTREDALVQGFLELVERDAVALWWYNRTRQPAVDLAAFDAPYLDRLTAAYREIGREVWALDLTSDLGIPVVAALSRRTDKPGEDIVFGFGAHFDPRIALRRAVTEMGQMLPAVAGARPDGSGYLLREPALLDWWQQVTAAGRSWLRPDPRQRPRVPAHWNHTPRQDLRDDIDAIVELVRGRGMELLVLDLTRPDIGLPVVRVVVPGLRPFWARLAPGRLYDVPVALGRLPRSTPYEDLNPVPLFV